MKLICAIAAVVIVITSCKEDKVRTYTEKKSVQPTMAPMPAGHPPANAPAPTQAKQGASHDERPSFNWVLPKGWSVTKGGGMISATFLPVDNAEQFKATLIVLSGAAGGVDANLGRWLGQLGLSSAPGEIGKVKAKSTPLKNASVSGTVYDLTLSDTQEKTFYVALLPVNGSSVFVKFIADLATAKRNKAKFQSLLNSLELVSHVH